MYISPLNLLAGLLALILILFIIITTTVAYTPILDFIPGYPGNKSRTMLIENIIRLDSLEQEIKNMQIYNENIALIMAGKNPVTRNDVQASDSVARSKNPTVAAIIEDSILLEQPGCSPQKSAFCIGVIHSRQRGCHFQIRTQRGRLRHQIGHHGQPAGNGHHGWYRHLLFLDTR